MPVFMVAPDNPSAADLATKIASVIPAGSFLRLPGGAWLVSYDGTTRALSDAIGLSEGTTSAGVVVSFSSYWGRASKDVWEWIEQKNK